MTTNLNMDLSKVTGCVIVIPAAGIGKRFKLKGTNTGPQSKAANPKIASANPTHSKLSSLKPEQPKQYQLVKDKKILDITLEIFIHNKRVEKILLIVSPGDELFKELKWVENSKLIIVDGAHERQLSVSNGLKYCYDNDLPDDTPLLVHDAVRPCLSTKDLNNLLDYYHQHQQACFLAEPVADSLKKINPNNRVIANPDRDDLVHALTPQMASFIELKESLKKVNHLGIKVSDEVGALTDCEIDVFAVFAQDANPKITYPKDIELVKQILSTREINQHG